MLYICNVFRDLILFVQFKRREKDPWRSITFSKVAGLEVTLLHGYFSRFLSCTNGTKSRNASKYKTLFHFLLIGNNLR